MQPNDSVHHDTIRLVSLSFRFRRRMATVLSMKQHGGSSAPSRDVFVSRLRRADSHRATERSIHLVPLLRLWPERLQGRVETAAKENVKLLVAPRIGMIGPAGGFDARETFP